MGKKVKKETESPPKDVFDPLMIESKTPATVVLMLSSPENEVLAKACDALYKFASKGDENKVTLLGLGALEHLYKLLSHEDPLVRRNAVMVVGIMASNNDVRKLLRELDVTNSLISQLAPEEDVVIHEFATLCLAYMAVEYTTKVKIFEQGGLEPLIRLLGSPDPDVTKNSLECIYLLVQDFQNRAAVRELNVIPPLLGLLESEYPVIQSLALQTLEVISKDRETRILLEEYKGLDCLLNILENNELNDLHVETLAVLGNCLEDVHTLQQIQLTGGIQKLLSFLKVSTVPDIQKNAAKAITNAAYDSEIRKILHWEEVETFLLRLLETNNDDVKVAASQAISAMCENIDSKCVLGLQGIPQLVKLLSSDNEELKEVVVTALTNLTTANLRNASVVAKAEGIAPLIKTLNAQRDGAISNAIAVLTNLALQEPIRASIQSQGIMSALVGPLRSTNSQVQSKAAFAVAAFACDAGARAELRNVGGLGPLVELLHSNYEEVRRNACWAVMVCGSDEVTAFELCRLGALDILEEINLSSKRKNKFSEAALETLLDNNLSQKYSRMGYLSPSNIITNGFYDCGQVKHGGKFLSLEELSKQELTDRRAIIFINAKPQESVVEVPEVSPPVSGRSSKEKPRFVAERMGGPVEKEELHNFCWELDMSEIEFDLKSNIVPIGKIKRGTFYHRALLFKVIADRIGIGCSLVRGKYNRCWNEVKLVEYTPKGLLLPPQEYVVDVMFEPGLLFKQGSAKADQYKRI
ncbi:armadillo repeat-containing protein 3 isoform X2 [Melospiza melodia melodia]|uniref:armadillo repeat-containing protein 3 isoform X2 n=1 Tax=Melospiza melodia melodia TaxID=1914991 RepID=UPI002FD0F94D